MPASFNNRHKVYGQVSAPPLKPCGCTAGQPKKALKGGRKKSPFIHQEFKPVKNRVRKDTELHFSKC